MSGRCRGDLMGRWGENVVRRFGPNALARVRARLEPPLDQLSSVLTARDWIPIYAQVVVTEAIVDELLDGDLARLYPLLVEDTRAGLGRLDLALIRGMGPVRAFKLGPRSFRKVHDRGNVEVEVSGRRARLQFADCPLFGHPTWRILQLYAQRVLLELCGTPGSADGEGTSDDGFTVIATW
jgi:hypothetical protein